MRIIITGSKGQLGQEFYRIKNSSKHEFLFTDLQQLNICSVNSINSYLNDKKIDCIINCAAYTDVRKAEIEKHKALNINSIGIELVNKGHRFGYEKFNDLQINKLIVLCKNIRRKTFSHKNTNNPVDNRMCC